jgi:hypothetical protein
MNTFNENETTMVKRWFKIVAKAVCEIEDETKDSVENGMKKAADIFMEEFPGDEAKRFLVKLYKMNEKTEEDEEEDEDDDEEEDGDDGFEDCEWCGYSHHYEDKCPVGERCQMYEKWKKDEEEDDETASKAESEDWFDEKYPEAKCHRCDTKVTGSSVVHCGGMGGACETWYCGDCHEEGTQDCACHEEEEVPETGCCGRHPHKQELYDEEAKNGTCNRCKEAWGTGDWCNTDHNHLFDDEEDNELIICCRCFCKQTDRHCPDAWEYKEKEDDETASKAESEDEDLHATAEAVTAIVSAVKEGKMTQEEGAKAYRDLLPTAK